MPATRLTPRARRARLAALLLFGGAATLAAERGASWHRWRRDQGVVRLDSVPPGCLVERDGLPIGRTPLPVLAPIGTDLAVVLVDRDGFRLESRIPIYGAAKAATVDVDDARAWLRHKFEELPRLRSGEIATRDLARALSEFDWAISSAEYHHWTPPGSFWVGARRLELRRAVAERLGSIRVEGLLPGSAVALRYVYGNGEVISETTNEVRASDDGTHCFEPLVPGDFTVLAGARRFPVTVSAGRRTTVRAETATK